MNKKVESYKNKLHIGKGNNLKLNLVFQHKYIYGFEHKTIPAWFILFNVPKAEFRKVKSPGNLTLIFWQQLAIQREKESMYSYEMWPIID